MSQHITKGTAMNVEQRLAKLERTSRYWRFTAVALGLTLVAITAMGLADDAEQVPDVIKARRFEVVNEQGTPQVILSQHEQLGGAIGTYNPQGERVVLISLNATGVGGVINTFDGKGGKLVEIGAAEGRGGAIATYDGKGGELVEIGVTKNDEGVITTYDGKGRELVLISTTDDGEGAISTFNRAGQVRAQWP